MLSFSSFATGLAVLGLAACTQAHASVATDPKASQPGTVPSARSAQYLRDSVFNSYLDSLDVRIESIGRAARTLDSLARSLHAMPSLKLHVNGHCFGPIHIPSQTVGPDSLTIETPEVNIPEIEIPNIDIEFPSLDGTILSDSLRGENRFSIEGLPSSASNSYYFSHGTKRFYIRNVVPHTHAKRAANGSGVWLLDPKK
jgi:hypothetical protein